MYETGKELSTHGVEEECMWSSVVKARSKQTAMKNQTQMERY
jgi:hypothetical protein